MTNENENVAGNTLITIVFLMTALLFLFPYNHIIPFDRRLSGLLGICLCLIIKWLTTTNQSHKSIQLLYDPLHLINFSVLIILFSIMILNYLLLNQSICRKGLILLQDLLRFHFNISFYIICFITFIISPFITNDGMCLLIIQPILESFLPTKSINNTKLNFQFFQKIFLRIKHIFPFINYWFTDNITTTDEFPLDLLVNDLEIIDDSKTNRFFLCLGLLFFVLI